MKIFVTKYAMKTGIVEMDADEAEGMPGCFQVPIKVDMGTFQTILHPGDYEFTLDLAKRSVREDAEEEILRLRKEADSIEGEILKIKRRFELY